ncbi:MAG TPA: glycosyltransferase family 1 protein [Cyclobacteriaceae bacterium]|nr:glycosyltransferase family 1 protein [Cyclobacteriaceae bacterium]
MKNVLIDNRWMGDTGIGRLCKEVINHTPDEVNSSFVSSNMGLGNLFSPLMLGNEIRKHKPEIFYSPSFMPPVAFSTPYIFTVHDLMHLFYYTKMHRVYYQQVIAKLAKKAKAIITVSHYSKQQLVDLLGIREELISVIYNGVDPSFYQNREAHAIGRPYLLYVGNRRKNKNLAAMLVAFAQADIPKEFVFLLTGNPNPELVVLLSKLRISSRVRFLGFVKESELPKLYHGAYATMFVSLMEGFGLPVIESMASGTPVLTSSESSLPEVAGGAALCVNPYNVDAITSGINKLVSDQELYSELKEKGLRRAQDFSWKKTAQETWNTILS